MAESYSVDRGWCNLQMLVIVNMFLAYINALHYGCGSTDLSSYEAIKCIVVFIKTMTATSVLKVIQHPRVHK